MTLHMAQPTTVDYLGINSSLPPPETPIEFQDYASAEPPSYYSQLSRTPLQSDEEESVQSGEERENISRTNVDTKGHTNPTLRDQWTRIGSLTKILRPLRPISHSKRDSGVLFDLSSSMPGKPLPQLKYDVSPPPLLLPLAWVPANFPN